MAHIHKQDVHARDLSTRSVTFYPTRAQIVRDITDVILKVWTFSCRARLYDWY